jgi:hypothetical protein
VLEGDRDGAVALEGHPAGEHLVDDDAHRVQVGTLVDRLAALACSGARYWAVPRMEPASVICESPALAMPKSVTFTVPDGRSGCSAT